MEDKSHTVSEHTTTKDQTDHNENKSDGEGESTGVNQDGSNVETENTNLPAVQNDAEASDSTNLPAVQNDAEASESTDLPAVQNDAEASESTDLPAVQNDAEASDSTNLPAVQNDAEASESTDLPAVQNDAEASESTNINVETIDVGENTSTGNSNNIQDNTGLNEGETILSERKVERKKHATFSEEAPTITITGEDSCPESPRDLKSEEQEVNNNTEKSVTDESESKGRCPIYFGIKSYLHQFYAPPDKDVLDSGEYIQEDDFEFVVEPGKRRWRGFWFRVGMWMGINLILLGLIALLVGYLTPPRQTIVGRKENLEILDRWAIAFNRRLEICRFVGLCVFCCGAVIVMLTLLVSSYQQDTTYYVVRATVVPETFIANPLVGQQQRWSNVATCRIPITGTIRNIQPSILSSN